MSDRMPTFIGTSLIMNWVLLILLKCFVKSL